MPNRLTTWWRGLHRWERFAVLAWSILIVAVSARVMIASPRSHTVYPIFALGGEHWRAGTDCYTYEPGLDLFRYSPLAAAGFAPWSLLPLKLGGVAWRWFGAAVFLVALADWARRLLPGVLSPGRRGLMFALAVPFALHSFNNGQLNLLMIALLMFAASAALRERWTLAAVCVVAAAMLKIYPLAFGLLLAAMEPRRFAPRLAAVLAAAVALPYLLQDPAYVTGQYHSWWVLLSHDTRILAPLERCPRDLMLLLRVYADRPSVPVYMLIQLATAFAAAVVCVVARLRWGRGPEAVALAFHLGVLWMLLLGPATESCTYTLIAPSLAGTLVAATAGRKVVLHFLLVLGYGLFLTTTLAAAFPQDWRVQALGLQPLGALTLLGVVLAEAVGRRPAPEEPGLVVVLERAGWWEGRVAHGSPAAKESSPV